MKAEDTILKDYKYAEAKYMGDRFLKVLKNQAEFSFNAGIREVVDWLNNHIDVIAVGQDVQEAAGNSNKYGLYSHIYIRLLEWQNKIKEWNIK